MIGGLSTSQIIIVHGGQVVVNQRHGVDHLQGDCSRHGNFFGTTKHFTGRQTQDGSDTFSSRHQRISHRFRDQVCLRFRTDHRFHQRLGNGRLFAHDVFGQVKLHFTATSTSTTGNVTGRTTVAATRRNEGRLRTSKRIDSARDEGQ